MSGPLILSVFPGIDLLGRAFEAVWPEACLVRGPDLLWGGDIRTFHPPAGRFDGVIGGPPCQAWSRLRHLVEHNGYALAPDLIPEFERVVAEAQPAWFLMENVPDAPLPNVLGYGVCDRLIRDVWVGGVTCRLRRFSFGLRGHAHLAAQLRFQIETMALHRPDPEPAMLASTGGASRRGGVGGGAIRKARNHAGFLASLPSQGLPVDFLADAPFTIAGKIRVVGNGVPMAMGRAIAKAVRAAVEAR